MRLAPAVETLTSLLDSEEPESFDWVYIDADKSNYLNYYKLAKQLIRKGGVIMLDNVLWSGKVVDESIVDDDTVAIRNVNDFIANDDSVDIVMLPIADGLTIARKK